jgi:hypothetical protein
MEAGADYLRQSVLVRTRLYLIVSEPALSPAFSSWLVQAICVDAFIASHDCTRSKNSRRRNGNFIVHCKKNIAMQQKMSYVGDADDDRVRREMTGGNHIHQ